MQETMTKQEDAAAERRRAFGNALADAMSVRDLTQSGLGKLIGGVSQPSISAWLSGESVPASDVVFELERVLELPPGHLSRHLGYLPLAAVKAPPATFEAVVTGDPLLDEAAKRGFLGMYRELTSRRITSRGGRPKKK